MSDRRLALEKWLATVLGEAPGPLRPVSSDASARRYWRLDHRGGTLVAVDAPPPQEDVGRFVELARAFRAIGLNTPEVHALSAPDGFLLLGDLGERSYYQHLDAANADQLYADAIAALVVMQTAGPTTGLPHYDGAFLRRELGLFSEWLLEGLLSVPRTAAMETMLARAFDVLVEHALAQPRVCVHRDYHSRNLMVTGAQLGANPGILDFQDAVVGPVTYDLVSLLKDCYIDWPRDRVEDWASGYFDLAVRSGILRTAEEPHFLNWFDLMGVQRHLKAAGIFARLALRDGKPGYLADLPRTLGYVVDVASRHPALGDLGELIATTVLPRLADRTGPGPGLARAG